MDYTIHKQTYKELGLKYNKSVPTIRKYFDQLDKHQPKVEKHTSKTRINVVMDTTFFGRGRDCLSVMVFRDSKGRNLHWKFSNRETIRDYTDTLYSLQSQYSFKSFTVDNRSGLIKALERLYPTTPIQLCQFHAIKAATKHLGYKPKSKCGRSIKRLLSKLTELDREEFVEKLNRLVLKYYEFLQERNHKGEYQHQEVRSSINSIRNNLPHLFTYKRYPYLNIPNTTNSAEGSFGNWKKKVKLHKGISRSRKKQMVNQLLQDQD